MKRNEVGQGNWYKLQRIAGGYSNRYKNLFWLLILISIGYLTFNGKCLCGNDGYPNFENILHNDDDSSFNFILCVSSECKDLLPTKCTEKCNLLGRKMFSSHFVYSY